MPVTLYFRSPSALSCITLELSLLSELVDSISLCESNHFDSKVSNIVVIEFLLLLIISLLKLCL